MTLSKEALREFENLLKEDYPREKFTKEQIREMAIRTLRIVELTFIPIPEGKHKKIMKTNNEKG